MCHLGLTVNKTEASPFLKQLVLVLRKDVSTQRSSTAELLGFLLPLRTRILALDQWVWVIFINQCILFLERV